MKRPTKTILQIIPADGWVAVYFLDHEPWFEIWSVACWTLNEATDAEGTYQHVDGLMADEVVADTDLDENFYLYTHLRDITPEREAEWAIAAKKRLQVSPAPSPGSGGGR